MGLWWFKGEIGWLRVWKDEWRGDRVWEESLELKGCQKWRLGWENEEK